MRQQLLGGGCQVGSARYRRRGSPAAPGVAPLIPAGAAPLADTRGQPQPGSAHRPPVATHLCAGWSAAPAAPRPPSP